MHNFPLFPWKICWRFRTIIIPNQGKNQEKNSNILGTQQLWKGSLLNWGTCSAVTSSICWTQLPGHLRTSQDPGAAAIFSQQRLSANDVLETFRQYNSVDWSMWTISGPFQILNEALSHIVTIIIYWNSRFEVTTQMIHPNASFFGIQIGEFRFATLKVPKSTGQIDLTPSITKQLLMPGTRSKGGQPNALTHAPIFWAREGWSSDPRIAGKTCGALKKWSLQPKIGEKRDPHPHPHPHLFISQRWFPLPNFLLTSSPGTGHVQFLSRSETGFFCWRLRLGDTPAYPWWPHQSSKKLKVYLEDHHLT